MFVLNYLFIKVKQCLDVTNAMGEDEKSLCEFNGHVVCEPPNNNLGLYVFSFVMGLYVELIVIES